MDLSAFKYEKTLQQNVTQKRMVLYGTLDSSPTIVILTKASFPPTLPNTPLTLPTTTTLSNDVYSKLKGAHPTEGVVDIDVIHPASAKHIAKYSASQTIIMVESPQLAASTSVPFMEAAAGEDGIGWVNNILSKEAEADRMVYEGDGFMIHPDLKWDRIDLSQLYMVVLAKERITSLRSLRAEHIPLLQAILDHGLPAVSDHYGVDPSQLVAFVHYPPTYYHFHVHVTHVDCQLADDHVGRAHLLSDIVANLSYDPNYYANIPLTLRLKLGTDFTQALQAASSSS